jgi:murein DD-endopeptidase MepM/ murein hydrolase activator NlpD
VYTVQRGDTLWHICARKLADGGIKPTNRAVHAAVQKVSRTNELENPDLILPGQRLDLSAVDGVQRDALPRKTGGDRLESARAGRPERVTRTAAVASRIEPLLRMVLPSRSSHAVAALSNTPSPWSQILGGPGRLTSVFGMRNDPFTGQPTHHDGLDIAADPGTTVYPLRQGRVTFSGWKNGYGQMVIVDHGNGLETVYGHTSKNTAQVGQWVRENTPIAEVGSTGRSTGPHLHFEARRNDRPIDPIHLITQGTGSVVTHVAKVS